MTFKEFLRDIALAAGLLLILIYMTSCAIIEKNIYVSTDGYVEIEYTTKSNTDVDAKGTATIPLR